MTNFSDEAQKTYLLIKQSLEKSGKAPTIKELAKELNLSVRKALEALRELEDSLIIKRSPYRSRSIEIISQIDEQGKVKEVTKEIPIVGTAPGGPFLFAEQNIENYISLPIRLLRGNPNVFLLRVVGNSMSPYLEDGDLALVKKQENANNRDVVVAVREANSGEYEATIKEFYQDGEQIVLNPINTKEYKPIIGNAENIKVQGVIVGAIKLFNN